MKDNDHRDRDNEDRDDESIGELLKRGQLRDRGGMTYCAEQMLTFLKVRSDARWTLREVAKHIHYSEPWVHKTFWGTVNINDEWQEHVYVQFAEKGNGKYIYYKWSPLKDPTDPLAEVIRQTEIDELRQKYPQIDFDD